ncbi:flavin reductase family protein [Aquibacillus koreensis]|uniref:Flavin reductase family protein n=1 Tax=Aquibacillus koreensis TaxID=279446 RepID=A0A9X4AIZ3_9BACI|nr:flavin reductase family protein [Aquibacillus koreensis]MCT2537742.1 flavin reductase family protein [Aquibacillus koreensis]MDC3421224.1 flavin reductase family protein [Aquibacillus koreensis]
MYISKHEFQNHDMSKLVKGAVVPRPIAWVSTIAKDGVNNIAPFSFFTVASLDPVTLCFSVAKGNDGSNKDTLENILETNEFVVNIVSESLANQMYETSKVFDPHVDEFEIANLDVAKSEKVYVPIVADAPIAMECILSDVIKVGTSHLVLGEVVGYHIHDEVFMIPDKVDPKKLKPIGRMAGDYAHIHDVFKLPTE